MNDLKDSMKLLASAISLSELAPNSIYMSVDLRMFSTRENGNGVEVTEAFIDDIVANKDQYTCIPLCADTKKLVSGIKSGLGHMLDRGTGKFYSEQIGAFSDFRKQNDEFGVSLIGTARIMKRNEAVCETLAEMYQERNLNFSFEIFAPDFSVKDGVQIIDVSENNKLIGMAVVSIPAYPEAKALALVAEIDTASRYEKVLKNAEYINVSEADYQTIIQHLIEMIRKGYGDDWWDFYVKQIGVDYVILYDNDDGKLVRFDYTVDGEEPVLLDGPYEVTYQRKEVASIMDEKRIAELERANADLTKSNAEMSAEVASLTNKVAELNATIEANGKTLTEKETIISELREVETKYNDVLAAEQARELAQKQEDMKAFAAASKLNVQDKVIAEAIANLDYPTLMKMASQRPVAGDSAGMTIVSSFDSTAADDLYA